MAIIRFLLKGKALGASKMTGTQRQVLRILKQLREADLKTIASTMGVSTDYVKDLCQGLIQDNLLRQGPDGQYMVTSKTPGTRWVRSRIQRTRGRTPRIQTTSG